MRYGFKLLGVVLFLCALVVSPSFAQETTGAIRGSVADQTGAMIPNAAVEISGAALIRPQTAKTDSAGTFGFLTLPPGAYSVQVTAQGFVTQKRVGIDLEVGKSLRIDFKMEVGSITQTVEVSAEAVQLDVTQTTVAANITSSTFDNLPKSRGFDSLIALAPGARYESKSGGYQVDGASASENIFIIDGMDQSDLYSGTLPTSSNIPFEFIQELQIKSSGFAAEYGGAMGGVINVVTKSGSNSFHGDVGLYLRTDSMQARPRPTLDLDPNDDINSYVYTQAQTDNYRNLNPGFTLGGPIKKDRIWFFAGTYPEFTSYKRPVTFIADGSKANFDSKRRRDYTNAKIDIAPTSKLKGYFGYIYAPYRVNGLLPNRNGSSDPTAPWADEGNRTPAVSYNYGADYTLTPKWLVSVHGGYNYTNYKDYGVPRGTSIYQNNNTSVAAVPAQWRQSYSGYTPGYNINSMTVQDVQTKYRTAADTSYVFNAAGQHTLKAGWEMNKLHKDSSSGTWPDGYLRFYWNSTYTGVAQRPGEKLRGTYGYVRYYLYGEQGGASSDNHALFLQDAWQVRRGLTLQLGLRTEREFVPSFLKGPNVASQAITFPFQQKLAPRLGAAWDVLGDGRLKMSGSFGLFYDAMKYSLPQGSFGGAVYKLWYYALDNPDPAFYISKIPRNSDGTAKAESLTGLPLFELNDARLASNDPSDYRIDKNLKPMRRRVYDYTVEYALRSDLLLSARYTHNNVDRIIEDVGMLTSEGEKYFITNPGFGMTADPKTWPAGYPTTPKAKRDYDALELRADKRFGKGYSFSASYTLSRLYGNYSGLASSDEGARQDPNASRYFDEPWIGYDDKGHFSEGRLATDRPHAFKFYGSYTLKSKLGETTFGPQFFLMSGTPLTTELDAIVGTDVMYPNGRGDMGRTPVYSNTNMYITHEFKLPYRDGMRVKVDLNIDNLFNQSTVMNKNTSVINNGYGQFLNVDELTIFKGFDWKSMVNQQVKAGDIYLDPRYGHANDFQGPRILRLGLKFIF